MDSGGAEWGQNGLPAMISTAHVDGLSVPAARGPMKVRIEAVMPLSMAPFVQAI